MSKDEVKSSINVPTRDADILAKIKSVEEQISILSIQITRTNDSAEITRLTNLLNSVTVDRLVALDGLSAPEEEKQTAVADEKILKEANNRKKIADLHALFERYQLKYGASVLDCLRALPGDDLDTLISHIRKTK